MGKEPNIAERKPYHEEPFFQPTSEQSSDMIITIPVAKPQDPANPGEDYYIETPDLPVAGGTLEIRCAPYGEQAADDDVYFLFIKDTKPDTDIDPVLGTFTASQTGTTPDTVVFNLAYNDIPKTDGFYRIWVFWQSLVGNEFHSMPYWVELDYTEPGGKELTPIEFRDYPSNRATAEDIANNGNVLRGYVTAYKFQAIGDRLTGMFRNVNPPGPWESITPVPVSGIRDTTILDFPLEALLGANLEGDVEFKYIAVDKAQNPAESGVTLMHLLIRNVPSRLQPLVFTETAADGVIYEEQARKQVRVGVPPYVNAAVGDLIYGTIEGQYFFLPALTNDDVDDPANPGNPKDPIASVLLTYADIRKIVDGFGGGAQQGTAVGTYKVKRLEQFEFSSPAKNQGINLILPPGPDPDPDKPEHKKIRPVVVRGPGSTEDNVVISDDRDNSTAILDHLLEGGTTPIFAAGDLVELHEVSEGGTEIGLVSARVSVVDPNQDLSIAVLPLPPGPRPAGVAYFRPWVGRQVAPGVVNFALGPVTRVIYQSGDDIPGGGHPLPEVVFRNALNRDTRPALNLERGQNGALIRVYIDEKNIKSGDFFEVSVYYNQRTNGGVFDPGTGDNADDLGAPEIFSYTIEARDLQPKDDWIPEDGGSPPGADRYFFDVRVPYATLITRIIGVSNGQKGYGSLWATYSVRRDGKDYPSIPRYTPADGTDPAKTIKYLIVDVRPPGTGASIGSTFTQRLLSGSRWKSSAWWRRFRFRHS